MKKKFINTEKIIGRVYSHKLEQKTVKNEASANYGKPFIAGTVEIAVDEEGLNVIPVHFTYETGESKKETYDALKLILESNKVWTAVGKDDAIKVRIDTTLSVNDFIARDSITAPSINISGSLTAENSLSDYFATVCSDEIGIMNYESAGISIYNNGHDSNLYLGFWTDTTSGDPNFTINEQGIPNGLNTAKAGWKTWLGIDAIENQLSTLVNANGVSY